jgi:hypothetical protein
VGRTLDIIERIILLLLAIPVVAIVVDAALRMLSVDLTTTGVMDALNFEDNLSPDFLDSIFTDPFTIGRLDVQTALLNLLFYGVLVLATIFAFKLIRFLVARS